MLVGAVDRDPLQTLVIRLAREVHRNTGVIGHLSQGAMLQFAATGQINADHGVAVFLHREQLLAIAAESEALQIRHAHKQRLTERHPALEIHAIDGLGVVADGIKRRAISIQAEP